MLRSHRIDQAIYDFVEALARAVYKNRVASGKPCVCEACLEGHHETTDAGGYTALYHETFKCQCACNSCFAGKGTH
jgi:hypothetical protein